MTRELCATAIDAARAMGATEAQIEQLGRHAINDVTREIMDDGITLTWEQADDLGEEVIDWACRRLDLVARTSDVGITLAPREVE